MGLRDEKPLVTRPSMWLVASLLSEAVLLFYRDALTKMLSACSLHFVTHFVPYHQWPCLKPCITLLLMLPLWAMICTIQGVSSGRGPGLG